jgi:molybdopterin molybdotransferase
VLAVPLVSEIQVPGFDNSAMDGYAVRTADTAQPMAQLKVTQRIAAGSRSSEVLRAGQAARIFTGAPIPEGADAVVMQEEVQSLPDDRVSIQTVPSIGQCIRRRGEDIALGQLVLEKGCRLGPAELGLAASIGRAELTVVRKPRVALFSTGDELIMPGSMPPSELPTGAIYNSNRFFLSAMLQRAGCEVTDLGIVPDQRQLTIDAMAQAASHHDLILTSGGVSVGEEDHVKPAVQALGELHLWSLAIKPGKPFALGTVRGINQHQAHFIGLPGNPVSSFVTFLLLARPFLLKMQGVQQLMPRAMKLPANFVWARADRRREFLRARRNQQGSLDLFANQSSGVLTSVTWADGLIDLAAGQTIQAGDWVDFIPFSEWL